MKDNFNILVNKLNAFRFKYYSYKLLRGLILTLFLVLVIYSLFSIIEYYVFLSVSIRKIFFFGFIIFSSLLFIQFIGIPFLKLLHILKPIDLKSTSLLIQKHFSEIKDKLLNIIELADFKGNEYSKEIVFASINQKINELKIFEFNDAVQFKNIRTILIYLLISVLSTAAIFTSNKNVYADSTHRLVNYNTAFTKPAPYSFKLLNTSLKAKKGEPFKIQIETKGNELPQIIYINIEGNNYLMKNFKTGFFEYEMASVINSVQFYFTDLKFNSKIFQLELLPKPGITQFTSSIYPPNYTRLPNQVLENIGDLQVPNGTEIKWLFNGIDVDSLFIVLKDSTQLISQRENNSFNAKYKCSESINYNVFIKNNVTEPEHALSFSIEVISDLFPEIEIKQIQDSLHLTRFFFKGVIGDDYGFSKLKFHYNFNNSDSTINIPVVKSLNDQEFYFSYDFNELNNAEGVISYYFSVTDNDVVNSFKTTTSNSFIFEFPNKEELLASDKEQFNKLENMVVESRELAKDIQKDLNNLQLKNMDSNVSEWEKSQMVGDIISKQNTLKKLYNEIKKDNEKLNNFLNSFNEQNKDILEKQQQIEELLKDVFTDELKELMKEFNKLADEFNSKNLNQLSEKMDLTFEDLQKQLDRNLEMLRKMKLEQKIKEVIDNINKIAAEETKLAEEITNNKNFEEVKDNVSQHQKEIELSEKNLNDALELNRKLEKPMNFDDFDEDFDDVNKSIEESKQELDKKNRKKSETNIKSTSNKLQNLAFGMQQMLDSNTMQKNMENIENLKQILSNLIYISFSQEDILTELQGVSAKDPILIKLNKNQKAILDQSLIVKDSMYALAMRTPQITGTVNSELLALELNLKKASEQMEEALFPNARVSQQFVITSTNNLALLLNEALENLEEQMANAKPGDQQCEKPGSGKPGMDMLKKAGDNIKQQLQQMIDQMKNGNPKNMSQQMGQSLMQHEMMQQMLRDLMNNGSVGSGAKKQLQEIDNILEQNRKQLMNKNINAQTIARQNLISTRLLEAEKAELEREFENKRESESAEDFYSNPVKFFKYKEIDNFTIEYLNKNTHKLSNFYISKYKQYLNNVEKNSDK